MTRCALRNVIRVTSSEFAKIKANSSKNLEDMMKANQFIDTVKKHRTFEKTPSKLNAEHFYDQDVADLSKITDEMEEVLCFKDTGFDSDIKPEFVFDDASYKTIMDKIMKQMEKIFEFALSVENLFAGEINRIQGHVQPLEGVLTGIRLSLAAVKETLGIRTPTNTDIPPVVWTALESAFDSMTKLETGLVQAMSLAAEAKEIGITLLDTEEDKLNTDQNTDGASVESEATEDQEESSSTFLATLTGQTYVDKKGILHPVRKRGNPHKASGQDNVPSGGGSGGVDCCSAAGLCSLCAQQFADLEAKVTALEIRLAHLEQAKSGNVECAMFVKHKIFRGRSDVIAWLDQQFLTTTNTSIEAACFSTPHMIFNLVSSDMCGLAYPKLDLKESDLAKLRIKRSDAIAFYALLQDRPDFMISNSVCPMHTYKSSKSERDKASIKFVPTYADFGMSSDPDTLHYKFKTSLHLIRERQESYIESRLGHHQSRFVYEVS